MDLDLKIGLDLDLDLDLNIAGFAHHWSGQWRMFHFRSIAKICSKTWQTPVQGIYQCVCDKVALHSKQKVGRSWSQLVALGHRAKWVTHGQVTTCELNVQLITRAICL